MMGAVETNRNTACTVFLSTKSDYVRAVGFWWIGEFGRCRFKKLPSLGKEGNIADLDSVADLSLLVTACRR